MELHPDFAPEEPIYHISVIGFRFRNPRMVPALPHAPVSRETLDASVTRLVHSTAEFPSADEGISQWREARGGVFTIPVAEIVEVLDQQTAQIPE